ncbi:hypothetical protein ACP4OV_006910 [Aristida adscensionis]
MAELAAGAVSSLLGVIRNEMALLGGVRGDVQFIKEEMESMSSFLVHLAHTAPPGGEHDEQVRTWMNQVRLLAQDCNNCLDLYLYRGNPDIHRARGGLRRFLWWLPWFLQKLAAQRRAAVQLRLLKERARDVGERRLRYGVKVPATTGHQSPTAAGLAAAPGSAAAKPAAAAAAAAGGGAGDVTDQDNDDDDDDGGAVERLGGPKTPRALFLQPRTLEEHVKAKLLNLLRVRESPERAGVRQSIAIVAPDAEQQEAAMALAHGTLVKVKPPYYDRRVLVDIQAMHHRLLPLRPKEVLYYILRELEAEGQVYDQWDIYEDKKSLFNEFKERIQIMKVYEKLDKIKSEIIIRARSPEPPQQQDKENLGAVFELLAQSAAASQQDQVTKTKMHKLAAKYDGIITKLADKLKHHMEDERVSCPPIRLEQAEYEHILREVFPKTSSSKPLLIKAQQQDRSVGGKQSTKTTMATPTLLSEDQIKQIVHEVKQEILRELQDAGKAEKNQATGEPAGGPGPNPAEDVVEDMEEKMEKIKLKLKEQLKIRGMVDRIQDCLQGDHRLLIILKVDEMMDGSIWEDTRNSLSLLQCSTDALIFTTTKDIQRARQICYPCRESIDYSLAGLYQDTVLEITRRQKSEENYNPQIFRDILEECKPDEFCMKMFTHALYANPKRSNAELQKLHSTLQALPKSSDLIAKKMFKFSYNDLPKEYQSCLLYLAIFFPRQKIRRSTLTGRWVVEGLIFHDDWPNSVRRATRCFDELIDRWLIYPADIGATGKVKSCVVGDQVRGFIKKIAKKQHIVDTRLSHHLARHFSIFNNLHLHRHDGIDKFFQMLSESSRVSLLKVLDLEDSQCFAGKKHRYLKVICSKMLLLKYLSLKGTNIKWLPTEINKLRELEVLDIRQTNVPDSATGHVLLLKLKRLLAGSTIGDGEVSSVRIPEKIEKMVNVEVLSNVKAHSSQDLKDIGKLYQLRKLGVVITDKEDYLRKFFQTIKDLHESLRSLSITIPMSRCEGTPSSRELLQGDIGSVPKLRTKLLESLSISGTTQKGHLLPLFAKVGNNNLAKVTLSRTQLNQDNLKVLANLPKLKCVRLRHIACADSKLIFEKDGFKHLKCLLVEGSDLADIVFESRAACELEKMVLSSTNIGSIHGVDGLQKLEELELNNNNNGRLLSSFDNAKQIAKLTLRGTLMDQADLHVLAEKPKMRCLLLLDKSCALSQIIFNKDEFPKLNLLTIDCSSITKIIFTSASAPELEKIIWSSPTSLSGIDKLPRLKQLEFNGDVVPKEVKETITKHSNKVHLKHNQPANQDHANPDAMEGDAAGA